jgi:pyruvate dehydrogenase phosphatase regulatory subunit
MIAPTIQQTRCKAWIQRHLGNYHVNISDITSMYTAICIMGPFSRTLLSELTDTDLSPKNFPFFTYKVSLGIFCYFLVPNLSQILITIS